MKKYIIVSPFNPFPPRNGGERRIYLLTKKHATRNRVFFFGPKHSDKVKERNIHYIKSFQDKKIYRGLSQSLIRSIAPYLKKEHLEICLEFPWQAINLMLLGKRYILDEHNVEFLRFKRMGYWFWPGIYIYEFLSCHFAKNITCVSEIDKNYLIKYFGLNSNKIKIIENPVDREVFYPKDTKNLIRKKLQLKQKDKFILFFGQLNYKPNIEALEIIKNEIIPRLDSYKKQYKIAVCGAGNGKGFLKEFKHKNIIFKGFVNKIQDYINASDVVIVPLKSGSGTRIKILEALACKKRVISTSIGAEGIKPNKLLEVEDDWNKFVEKI